MKGNAYIQCTAISIAAPSIMIEAAFPRLSTIPPNTGVRNKAPKAGSPAKNPATLSSIPYLLIISSEANFWNGNTHE